MSARPAPLQDGAPIGTGVAFEAVTGGRSYAAIVLGWSVLVADGTPTAADLALLRRVGALIDDGLSVAVVGAPHVEALAALGEAVRGPRAPGRVLVSAGPGPTLHELVDTGWDVLRRHRAPMQAARLQAERTLAVGLRDVLASLFEIGVGPGLVLVVGNRFAAAGRARGRDAALLVPEARHCRFVSVDPAAGATPDQVFALGGGEAGLRRVFTGVLADRRRRRVPSIDDDPAWVLCESETDPRRRRVSETLLSVVGGGLGTRGSLEDEPDGSLPLVLVNGVYTRSGAEQHLLPAPCWTRVGIAAPPGRQRCVLDMRTGVLFREELDAPGPVLRTARFASAELPGVVALRAEAAPGRLRAGTALHGGQIVRGPAARAVRGTPAIDGVRGGVVAVASQRMSRAGAVRTLERIAAYVGSATERPDPELARRLLEEAQGIGFERLLAAQRRAWAARWEDVDVRIPGDPEAQFALRYTLFQLRSHTAAPGELALGARGLTGVGYSGHVFWDADVFVLPALASIDPDAARAMVDYRLHRLPAARERARELGYAGARYPWESAATGQDVTPTSGRVGAHEVAILTGAREVHVTADVAWAAAFTASWEGRGLRPGERDLLVETARYWSSRSRRDADGRAHLEAVIGPDEYHEYVDDNAYTNVMARWNLRAAARAGRGSSSRSETRRWLDLADRLVDGYDANTGIYEQFAGYHLLENMTMADLAPPPVAADILLGPDRVRRTQLIKQPDVLMLHHLVPDEVAPGSLVPNLDFYGPRTAHGSSLSPALSAALLARSGRPDEALEMLRIALRLDQADLTGTTAAGLHMANLGGVWQCVLFGFAGVRVAGGCLVVDPRMPETWSDIELRFRALGRKVRIHIDGPRMSVRADGPLRVRVAGGRAHALSAGRPVQFRVKAA